MRKDIEQTQWTSYLADYTRRNEGRPTRLEVIGGTVDDDFWLECGLRLTGIDTDTRGTDSPHVEIMLGGRTARDADNHLTRRISCVRRITPETSDGGRDQVLEIEDANATTTILRFETLDA